MADLARTLANVPSHAHVHQTDGAVIGEHNVARRNIAMDKACLPQALERCHSALLEASEVCGLHLTAVTARHTLHHEAQQCKALLQAASEESDFAACGWQTTGATDAHEEQQSGNATAETS
jgi:hypothetical protein